MCSEPAGDSDLEVRMAAKRTFRDGSDYVMETGMGMRIVTALLVLVPTVGLMLGGPQAVELGESAPSKGLVGASELAGGYSPPAIRLIPDVVLKFPVDDSVMGPVALSFRGDRFGAVDIRDLRRVYVFERDGAYLGSVGPLITPSGRLVPMDAMLFREDGALRVLTGRLSRSILISRDLQVRESVAFPLNGVWNSIPAVGDTAVINVVMMMPGALNHPFHLIDTSGNILNSFGGRTRDFLSSDQGRYRYPLSRGLVEGTFLAVDPATFGVDLWTFEGEHLGQAARPPAWTEAFAGRRGTDGGVPRRSWQESAERLWSLSWIPGDKIPSGVQSVACPIDQSERLERVSAGKGNTSIVTLSRQPQVRSRQAVAVRCYLDGILPGGRVYLTTHDNGTGVVSAHVFRLEESTSLAPQGGSS